MLARIFLSLTILSTQSGLQAQTEAFIGQEHGGGIVFEIDGSVLVFAREERSRQFVIARDDQTRAVYEDVLVPQLERIHEAFPTLAAFLVDRFEGRKGPRWYFSKYELEETNDLGQLDIRLALRNSEGRLVQLARNNGFEIKVSNFDPRAYDAESEEEPYGDSGWESIESDDTKAWFLMYELLEAEFRREAARREVPYRIETQHLNRLTGALMSQDFAIRYRENGADFIEEFTILMRNVNPELTDLLTLLRSSDAIPDFEKWDNQSVIREDDGMRSADCRFQNEDCVFRDMVIEPLKYTNYWSEVFASEDPYESLPMKSKAEVLEILARVNEVSFGGFNDWRLPSSLELVEAMEHGLGEVIDGATFFGNIPNSRRLTFWTNTLDDREVVREGMEIPHWIYDYSRRRLDTTRFEADEHAWIFVRSDVNQNWQDVSTDPDTGEMVSCALSRHQCAFRVVSDRNDTVVSELSPLLDRDRQGVIHGYRYTESRCSKLSSETYAGIASWGRVNKDWHDYFFKKGLYRFALQYPKFGMIKGHIWSSEGRSHIPYGSTTRVYQHAFSHFTGALVEAYVQSIPGTSQYEPMNHNPPLPFICRAT